MQSVVYREGYSAFINSLAVRRAELRNWTALIVQAANDRGVAAAGMDEIVQVAEFQFHGEEVLILTSRTHGKVFIVTRNREGKALTVIEQALNATFGEIARVSVSKPLSGGLGWLCQALGECMPEGDSSAMISLKRLARAVNTFVVLSSDEAVGAVLCRSLQQYGRVIVSRRPSEMIAAYREYAPNAVFLDAGAEAIGLVREIRLKLDAHGHAVVLTRQRTVDEVVGLKNAGASGIVLKPATKDALVAQLLRIPTLHRLTAPGRQL